MVIEATELTWRDQVEFEAIRKAIKRAIQVRFGHVTPAVEELIDNTASDADLDTLFDRVLLARTENDVLHSAP